MHTWHVVAFLLFLAATIVAAVERAWVFALLAAGAAAFVLPYAFQLN
jgi:hypothetical protein